MTQHLTLVRTIRVDPTTDPATAQGTPAPSTAAGVPVPTDTVPTPSVPGVPGDVVPASPVPGVPADVDPPLLGPVQVDGRSEAPASTGPAGDAGMSTVEYAVGTVVAAAFAAVLYRIVTGDSIVAGLTNLVQSALNTGF